MPAAPARLNVADALLVVIDLQEKLIPHIAGHEAVTARAALLIRAAGVLGLPVLLSEQYRKGLGETIAPIRAALPAGAAGLEKRAFGCLADPGQRAALEASGRRQLLLVGIETHVCVLQTGLAALAEGYTVFLAEDALGSRRPADHAAGLRRLEQAGAVPATAEMLIMEALGIASGEAFKAILPLLKG